MLPCPCLQTSPADGTVLYLQEVQDGVLQQIKGVTYSLQGFLGPLQEGVSNASPVEGKTLSDLEYHRALVSQEGHSLYQCIVYLGPGDYHHFHSPADWSIRARRHFPGKGLTALTRVLCRKYICITCMVISKH